MRKASAEIVREEHGCACAPARARPSGKLPGWGKLIEICCDAESNLGQAAQDFDNVTVIRITKEDDWNDPKTVRRVRKMIFAEPGISVHASLECTAWTSWQFMNLERFGPEYEEKLRLKRERSRAMLASYIMIAEMALRLGGEVSFEWPKSCSGWLLPELIQFITRNNLFSAFVDGCSMDMCTAKGEPILKRWRFLTSSPRMWKTLIQYRCSHRKGFKHAEICSTEAAKSAYYPMVLCRSMLASLFGWYECTPMMACVPVRDIGHREKEGKSTPVECACAPPGDPEQPQVGIRLRIPAMVTKLLSFKETRCNPKAIAAVRAEIDALEACGTWDVSTLCEKQEVIDWATNEGITVHIGEGLGICSIKNHEMGEHLQKWKGRFCFRAPTARDQGGAIAVFQEMSSRPTTVVAVNVSVAYGCLHGYKVSVADAVKAYVQSDLKSKNPTYIEIPKHLCPLEWRKMHKPVCKLVKALYGHPEAGAHWERHLEKIVREMGGDRVPSHPSLFFFPEKKLLLTIYVDDLLLAGPEESHAAFWAMLEKKVNIEPPEDLDRYLGRYHTFKECDRLPYDLMAHFASPIQA
jgi:hypothetical protein